MAAEEDNFDIDIYGDGGEEYQQEAQGGVALKREGSTELSLDTTDTHNQETNGVSNAPAENKDSPNHYNGSKTSNGSYVPGDGQQKISSTDGPSQDQLQPPKQAPQQQGVKRKEGSDDRPIDPGATTALFISDLHWWTTDDDVRGWVNQSECEDELRDITFSEHKVNGKSKGQAFVEFLSPQAATAVKHKIESYGSGQQYAKKHMVTYTSPMTNPFRTLPKDAPMRGNQQNTRDNRSTSGASFNSQGGMGGGSQSSFGMNNMGGGYRGGRGGYNSNRGGGMNNMGNYNNRSFSGPMGGPTGYQNPPMGGFQPPQMGGMQQFGGFQNRGGMMGGMRGSPGGIRGGRGGMGATGMMGSMPMGAMAMGGMPGQMGGMGVGMGMGMGQMGGMQMQGMHGFNNPPIIGTSGYTSAVGGTVQSPAIHYHWNNQPASMGGRLYPVPAAASYPSQPSSHYSSQPSSSFSSQGSQGPRTPYTPISPLQSVTLKRSASLSGQPGFPGPTPHFNPAFFQQGQQAGNAGDGNWNPHGAKRTRQE